MKEISFTIEDLFSFLRKVFVVFFIIISVWFFLFVIKHKEEKTTYKIRIEAKHTYAEGNRKFEATIVDLNKPITIYPNVSWYNSVSKGDYSYYKIDYFDSRFSPFISFAIKILFIADCIFLSLISLLLLIELFIFLAESISLFYESNKDKKITLKINNPFKKKIYLKNTEGDFYKAIVEYRRKRYEAYTPLFESLRKK